LFYLNMDGSAASFRKKILKRCRTLAVPFLFWSTSVFIAVCIAQLLPATKDFFANYNDRNLSLSQALKTIIVHPVPYQLWFIRDLFLFVLLTPITHYVLRKAGIIMVLGIGIVWLVGMAPDWPLFNVSGFFFFTVGNFIALSGTGWRRKVVKPRWLIALWLGIVVARAYFLTYHRVDFELLWLHNIGILVGLAAFWLNYDLYGFFFEQKQVFQVTYLTFFVYAAHEPMLVISRKLWAKSLTVSEVSALVGYFVCPLLVILICITLAVFLKRYFRGLYQVMTGWR
jgi:hypothetical protein